MYNYYRERWLVDRLAGDPPRRVRNGTMLDVYGEEDISAFSSMVEPRHEVDGLC